MRRPGSPQDQPGPLEEHNFFRARIFRRLHLPGRPPLMRWTWVKIWAFGTMAGVTLALFQVEHSAEREDRKDAQQDIDLNYLNCLRGNELRELMKVMVIVSFDQPGLDLTGVPSFPLLPSSVQQFFRDLAALTTQPADPDADPTTTRNIILADIDAQVRDCEAEWAGHTPGLRLPHSPLTTLVTTPTTTEPVPFQDDG